MTKQSSLRRLLLLLTLIASLTVIPFVAAQESTTSPEGDAVDTEAAAAEAEAQEVGGEEETAAEGEAEAAVSPLVPLGINTGFLLAQILNFLLIATLLGVALWRPMRNMLDARAATIQRGLEDAAQAANARRNAEAEAEQIRAAARAETARIAEEARARGEEIARQIEAEARAEADRIRAEGTTRAEEERNRQLADLRGQVAAISVAMAERLIGASLDEKRQQALVSDFFTKVPADARQMTGAVEVVSAMPLSADEQQRVLREIGASDATFTVDPDILGGLIIRSQDRVVDGSVRSGLNELAARLR